MFLVYFYLLLSAGFTFMWLNGNISLWKALFLPFVGTVMLAIISTLPLIFLGGLLIFIAK